MKKVMRSLLAITMLIGSIVSVNASEDMEQKDFDPIAYDEFLYGSTIDSEYVIYDEEKGIDRLEDYVEYVNPNARFDDGDWADYYRYFSKVSWINRDGLISLSVKHTDAIYGEKENSWLTLALFHYGQAQWQNAERSNPSSYQSMYNQYVCHVDFAPGVKNPYNLEPSTPDKGYWGFVASACN